MATIQHLPVRPSPATPDPSTSAYAAFVLMQGLPPSWVRTFIDPEIADAMDYLKALEAPA